MAADVVQPEAPPPLSQPPALFQRRRREGMGLYLLGLLGALALHGAAGYTAHRAPEAKKPVRIEMAMVRMEPPPPPPPPPPEPEKPKEPPKKVQKQPVKQPTPLEPPPPPPPNATPPAEPPKKPVPILSGVTLESTVEGPSGFQVAVGNTLYDDPNKNKTKPSDVQKYSAPVYQEAPAPPTTGGTGRGPYKPAPKFRIETEPEVSREVKAAYPAIARQAGIEGVVELRVELWEDGSVRSAKVVRGIGYGLDEAAVEAMKKFLFKPATMDGKPVQYTISKYSFRFELDA